jgi:hypothetical protein
MTAVYCVTAHSDWGSRWSRVTGSNQRCGDPALCELQIGLTDKTALVSHVRQLASRKVDRDFCNTLVIAQLKKVIHIPQRLNCRNLRKIQGKKLRNASETGEGVTEEYTCRLVNKKWML